ncbi:tripartite tricarboxylate transporter substrate-binding protein [Marispirochaeta sp.]|uniref:tripartite tricarboxylate transporter substrate-binding protein n=1 Tax=Marispirochaeta sp. TaxID=2038653 RepID=UPI0029C7DC27|nr:tripartite tricarboxylate transporter substrate-binding protein [Marispirochaeta sp.]
MQFVVPAKAGGGTDAAARVISKTLQETLGRPFVVVNQPAGGGSVAAEQVRTAKPDGSTILFYHTSLLASYYAGLYDKSPIDEFTTCVVMPVGGSYALCVGPDSPYNSVADLVAAQQSQSGQDYPGSTTEGVFPLHGGTSDQGQRRQVPNC